MKKLILVWLLIPCLSGLAMGQTVAPKTENQSLVTRKGIMLSAADLNKYAGVYQLNENFKVTITVEGNKLFALAPGDQEKTEFVPETETKFIMKDSGAEIEFVEENGQRYLYVKMQQVLKLTKIS